MKEVIRLENIRRDFLASAERALKWFEMRGRAEASAPQAGTASAESSPRSIFVKTEYRLRQIGLDSIVYIEGLKDYVRIHTEDQQQPVLSLMSLKSLEEQLPKDRFMRVHRSFIVQLSKIRIIERNRIVFGNVYIPISETIRQTLFDLLSRHSLLPD